MWVKIFIPVMRMRRSARNTGKNFGRGGVVEGGHGARGVEFTVDCVDYCLKELKERLIFFSSE